MYIQRLLFVGVSPKLKGGVASVINHYSKRYNNSKFFCTNNGLNKYIEVVLFPIYLLCFIIFIIFNYKLNIIHIHGSSKGSFYRKYIIFIVSKYVFRKKIIYHIHSGGFHTFYFSSNSLVKFLISHFINNADTIICLSHSWKTFFVANFVPKRIEVIPNAVDEVEFEKCINYILPVKFLLLGKVGFNKGVFDLLEVCHLLRKEFKNGFEVWIGGDGEIDLLKERIKTYQLEDTVKYLGWLSGDKKESVLKEADVFVLPSYNEGLPVSILEAMAHKIPVISTTVGGIPEVIQHNNSGFLIEPGDKKGLYVNMSKFIENRYLIRGMGQSSHNFYKKNFTSKVVFGKLNKLYKSL